MNKILLIDDGDFLNRINFWKEKISGHEDIIDVKETYKGYFEIDPAGDDEIKPLFKADKYSYIFIHHSQQNDSLFPGNTIDRVKEMFQEKVVLFSGSIRTCELNIDNEKLKFRTIERELLEKNFLLFINYSIQLGKWEIGYVFSKDHSKIIKKRCIEVIISYIEQDTIRDIIFKSEEMEQLRKIFFLDVSSEKYLNLINISDYDLIEELNKL